MLFRTAYAYLYEGGNCQHVGSDYGVWAHWTRNDLRLEPKTISTL